MKKKKSLRGKKEATQKNIELQKELENAIKK
jgi:hypothetical protein